MDYSTLRGRIVQYFASGNTWSLRTLFQRLTDGNPPDLCYTEGQDKGQLKTDVASQVTAIVHEMMRCGILAPQLTWHHVVRDDTHGPSTRHVPLQVTEYGKSVLTGDADAVWEPVGYLSEVRKHVRGLHKLELAYLEESVRAFHLCLYRASLVMLGGASEALMGRVIRETAAKLPDGAKIEKKLDESILRGFRAWRLSLDHNRPRVPRREEVLQAIDHVFEIIRLCRNEAAHPKEVETNRLEVQTLLLAFKRYARSLLTLAKHLRRP